MPTTKQVEVKVADCLATINTCIDDGPISMPGYGFRAGKISREKHHIAQETLMRYPSRVQRSDVLFRNDQ